MKKTASVIAAGLLFITLTAQTGCGQKACAALAEAEDVRAALAGIGIVFDSVEGLVGAITDGAIDELLDGLGGDVAKVRAAIAALRMLLDIVDGLCPGDAEALGGELLARTMAVGGQPPDSAANLAAVDALKDALRGDLESLKR